jgi:hypothetical protein
MISVGIKNSGDIAFSALLPGSRNLCTGWDIREGDAISRESREREMNSGLGRGKLWGRGICGRMKRAGRDSSGALALKLGTAVEFEKPGRVDAAA